MNKDIINKKENKNKIICVIRIRGQIGIRNDLKETLYRLRLRRKYSCVVLIPTKEQAGMIKKVRNLIAFGEINEKMFENLIEKRGQILDKTKNIKVDAKKIISGIEGGKKYEDFNLKPFFRLSPPRGGIDSKIHFGKGKGVLGNNKEFINKLLDRML